MHSLPAANTIKTQVKSLHPNLNLSTYAEARELARELKLT
jgi:hypothetical protein